MGTFDNTLGKDGTNRSPDKKIKDAGLTPDGVLDEKLSMPNFSTSELKDVEAAAAAGNMVAQNELGDRHYNATGVPKSVKMAAEWWTKAAEQGHSEAKNKLAGLSLMETDKENFHRAGLAMHLPAAEKGDPVAQYNVAVCIIELTNDSGHPKAIDYLDKSARQGYAPALNNLGSCFFMGHGVPRDWSIALHLYEAAADQGYALAECNLGHCYGQGTGVELDYGKAAELFTRAAEKGEAQAQFFLGGCYRFGQGVAQDDQLSASWMDKAAQQGHPKALSCLGLYYVQGIGVGQDIAKGEDLLKLAAEKGDQDALLYFLARGLLGTSTGNA